MEDTYVIGFTRDEIITLIAAAYSAKHAIGGFDDVIEIAAKLNDAIIPKEKPKGKKRQQTRTMNTRRGRPRVNEEALSEAIMLYESGKYSMEEVVTITKISQATIFRGLREKRIAENERTH